nr:immunoglobulin heavy chain junction region [Mus musculus]NSM08765.1 immunoglobulin heavy chain junction region [Mus musculus]
CASEIRGFAYW